MRDLTAQVTSSLLPFPGVTTDALGEDEITLDSVLHGKFTVGRNGLAWLACGPHLEVVHAVTGERLSAYCFSGGGEHPPSVLAARDFSWLKRSGLLVGLEEMEGSMLCLYDMGLSRVVKAVVIPGRITVVEPLVSYGGASTSTQHLHQSLRWFFGIAAVVTDVGHVLLVDLCLDDLSCSQSELEASDLEVVTKSPAEIPRLRDVSSRQGRHLCLQLNGPTGVGATAMQYIPRTNQLAVGFSDGYLQLWNMKTLKEEYHSQLDGGRLPVLAFTFQEPENDPRNCCYLWAVQSAQDLEGDVVSLHLLQLAFTERKCLSCGKIIYEGLEYCEERFSQELSGPAFPHRAQATNTRLLSCQTIEKFRPHPDRDDSMNEVASPDTSVSLFSWQVRAYGQGMPSTYIGVFDINRWYHAQMPDSLRTGESLQSCPYLAVWSLDLVMQMVSPHTLLDVMVLERSLSRGLPFTCPPPEQYFNPTTYNFDATCLLNAGIVHLTCSGYQRETLSFLKKAAPCSSDIISTCYSRCLMSGLLSSRLTDTQVSDLSQEEQLDAILSTAVETSSVGLITGCIKQWAAEEQPGSALNLRYILEWAWNKVVQTKEELDNICAPLFDSSSNFTDPQTMQLLQHSQRLLGNLSTIFQCLLSEAHELTHRGLVGLMNKNMVSSLISQYAQVVLWFCRTGLLPEGSDDDALQISRPFYSHSVINNYCTIRREELTTLAKGKWSADCLMVDGLVGHCGERLVHLWKRDEGGTGQYPPPTLHALLDIYLLDSIEEAAKHAIVIYLLLDVMYSLPNKEGASVESFPTAFAIPIGLVKLVQGLWLLDHREHQSSLELLLHPAASQCQFEWQHERILQALMCQGQHSGALRYFHIVKPPITSTSQAKLCLAVLLHNRCLVDAWSLLRQHSNRLNMEELLSFLYESSQELGLIKELLKLPLGLTEQECLQKHLQGTGGLQNRELLMVHYLQQANYIPALQLNHSLKMSLMSERDPKLKERSNTRNSLLDQYGKVLPRVQMKLAMERAKPYKHPSATHREVSRPQPLSTITKRSANEKVMSRAGFINNVLTKIEEVWSGKGTTPQSSPAKSNTTAADFQSPKPSSLSAPDPFLGTPITMTSKRKSRLLDWVVQPSCQTPNPPLSSSLNPSTLVSPKSISKAPELCLLQTPQVVKRARALAASGPVFTAFTPQSILRSSLRPTPVATPSASPGRSVTPPPRSKESRITFIEDAEMPEVKKGIQWSNGPAAEGEISLLSQPTSQDRDEEDEEEEEENLDEAGEQEEQEEIASAELKGPDSESSFPQDVSAETYSSGLEMQDAMATQDTLKTCDTSVQSTDTAVDFSDAPLAEQEGKQVATENEDEVVTVNFKAPAENELCEMEGSEQDVLSTDMQTSSVTSVDTENNGEEVKEDQETDAEQGVQMEEDEISNSEEGEEEDDKDAHSEKEELGVESNLPVEDGLSVDPEDESVLNEAACVENTAEDSDKRHHLESQEQPGDAGIQQEMPQATESLDSIKESEDVIEELAEEPAKEATEMPTEEPTDVVAVQPAASVAEPAEIPAEEPASEAAAQPQESALGSELEASEEPAREAEEETVKEATVEPAVELDKDMSEEPAEEPMEQETADLSDFVEHHLFGSDLSPLTRTGIHSASHPQISFSSDTLDEDEDDEITVPEGSPSVTSQKSAESVTSSEPSGTDSHSVVSVNDSEELSSLDSDEDEEDGDEEEEGDEDEQEDSGSEVEIIEEVQGNGRLPPLQPSPLFAQEAHAHYLPSMSEDDAAALTLITTNPEMKMVEDAMESEVVMVRLGTYEGDVEGEEQQSYVELKPSTTLLVPLELVEGQHSLVDDGPLLDLPELGQPGEPEDDVGEAGAETGFSLMLELEEDGHKDTLPVENDVESYKPSAQLVVTAINEEVAQNSDVVLLGANEQENDLSYTPPGQLLLTDFHDEAAEKPETPLWETDDQDNNLQASTQLLATHVAEASEPDSANIIPLKTIDQEISIPENIPQLDQRKEMETVPVSVVDGLTEPECTNWQTDPSTDSAVAEQVEKESDTPKDVVTSELNPDQSEQGGETQNFSISEPPVVDTECEEHFSEDTAVNNDALQEEMTEEDDLDEVDQDRPDVMDVERAVSPVTEQVTSPSASPQPAIEMEEETKDGIAVEEKDRMAGGSVSEDGDGAKHIEEHLSTGSQPEAETDVSDRKTKAPLTPTRRSTRVGKSIGFVAQNEAAEEEGLVVHEIPTSPSRGARRSKTVREIKALPITPRRTSRRTQPELSKGGAEDDLKELPNAVSEDVAAYKDEATAVVSTPAKRRVSQRASLSRTRNSRKDLPVDEDVAMRQDEEVEKEVTNTSIDEPIPVKRRAKPEHTPRRGGRRILSSREAALETLAEEKEVVPAPPVKRKSRKTKTEFPEAEPALIEVAEDEKEDKKQQAPSPSRVTRRTSHLALKLYPQSLQEITGVNAENDKEHQQLLEPGILSGGRRTSTRRPTRSKLWDHPEEDLPLLDSPLEVDSETPVADALIKRLQDEEEKQEGAVVVRKTTRATTRSSRSSTKQGPSVVKDDAVLEINKPTQEEHSFIYSPARRRTRAQRTGSPTPSETSLPPVTRSTRRKDYTASQNEVAYEDVNMDAEQADVVSKARTTGKRTAKSKAVSEPPPMAEADLISPLPSPANPGPQASKRSKEGEAQPSGRSLRHKRIMNTVFAKPVTRRRKL